MTNWHGVIIGAISAVNPQTEASIRTSTGFTIAPDGTQTPAYTTAAGTVHVTALNAEELKHLNSLNLEGVMRKVYAYGAIAGIIRVNETGGDLLDITAGTHKGLWKIVRVFETWPGWCAIAVQLQLDAP